MCKFFLLVTVTLSILVPPTYTHHLLLAFNYLCLLAFTLLVLSSYWNIFFHRSFNTNSRGHGPPFDWHLILIYFTYIDLICRWGSYQGIHWTPEIWTQRPPKRQKDCWRSIKYYNDHIWSYPTTNGLRKINWKILLNSEYYESQWWFSICINMKINHCFCILNIKIEYKVFLVNKIEYKLRHTIIRWMNKKEKMLGTDFSQTK